jgi:serine/threonine-protein kinase mTOR
MEFPPETINIVQDPDAEKAPDAKSSLTSEPDDPYENHVVDLLLGILQMPSLSNHHHIVIDSLISIAKTRGMKFAPSTPKVSWLWLTVCRSVLI